MSKRIDAVLADYRKTADVPGFVKVKCLWALLKNVTASVKVEEINKIISDSLTKYIIDEKLDILGNPLPEEQIDWEHQEDFVFEYELGSSPIFELKNFKKNKIDYYNIKADDVMIDRYAKI